MGRIDTYPQGAILQPNSPVTLAYGQQTAELSAISAETDVPGLTVNVVVPEGRRIRVSARVSLASPTVANDEWALWISQDGVHRQVSARRNPNINDFMDIRGELVLTPTAGNHIYKASIQRSVGTGVVSTNGTASDRPAFILVEDITGMPLAVAPTSAPVGSLGFAENSADQAVTTSVDLTGLSVNVVVPSGRTLKITGQISVQSSATGDLIDFFVYDNGVDIKHREWRITTANVAEAATIEVILSPTAGSHTYNLRAGRGFSATGTITIIGTGDRKGSILVMDITGTPAAGTGAPNSTLGYAEVTANQGTFTAETDLTGLSSTVTVPSGRRIRISCQVAPSSSVANDVVEFRIKEGGTTLMQAFETVITGSPILGHSEVIISPSSGTHTYKLSMLRAAGTGNITNNAGSTIPSYILVEDITGAVWPSSSQVTSGMIASEAWTAYTPTWVSSGTAVSLGNGTLLGRYIKLGRTVIGAIYFSPGSTTTFGTGTYVWALPVAPSNSIFSFQIIGDAKGYNAGANCNAVATINGSGQFVRAIYSLTWPTGTETQFGQTAPWTWVSGNDLTINFTYEAAT